MNLRRPTIFNMPSQNVAFVFIYAPNNEDNLYVRHEKMGAPAATYNF